MNGRGVAAADYDNDGRVDIAVNTIGGKLILLHNTGSSGHWLEVGLRRFVPGAEVEVSTGTTTLLGWTQAGGSYLSSEDPRVHFGLGKTARVDEVRVLAPSGRVLAVRTNVPSDRILTLP